MVSGDRWNHDKYCMERKYARERWINVNKSVMKSIAYSGFKADVRESGLWFYLLVVSSRAEIEYVVCVCVCFCVSLCVVIYSTVAG